MLIANPNATATSPRMRDVLVAALAHEVDLDVVTTSHRGHAEELAAAARHGDLDLLVTLGGDGTINETVNGLLADGPGGPLPMLATIPGGSANVLARALGFPNDPIEATGLVLESLESGKFHTIGLGLARYRTLDELGSPAQAQSRWFTINAGIGLDAEVIAAMERQRAQGHTASGLRYLWTAVDEYVKGRNAGPDRRTPNLQIVRPGVPPITGVRMAIVQNTAPWTFFGPFPINPCPQASFDLGLDVFAPQSMSLVNTARFGARMLRGSRMGSVPNGLAVLHDQPSLAVEATNPAALQIDGEGMGRVRHVRFSAVAEALRIVG